MHALVFPNGMWMFHKGPNTSSLIRAQLSSSVTVAVFSPLKRIMIQYAKHRLHQSFHQYSYSKQGSRPKFYNHRPADILAVLYCRKLSSTPGLYLPDASRMHIQPFSPSLRSPDLSNVPKGAKSFPVEHFCSTYSVRKYKSCCCLTNFQIKKLMTGLFQHLMKNRENVNLANNMLFLSSSIPKQSNYFRVLIFSSKLRERKKVLKHDISNEILLTK